MSSEEIQVTVNNFLVPSVEKTSDAEIEEVCRRYRIARNQLPCIKLTDSSLAKLQVAVGDVVKVHRKSWVTGKETVYYRWIVP